MVDDDGSRLVDAYLAARPDDIREALQDLRRMIKDAVPGDVVEKVSYQVPTVRYQGRAVVAYGAHTSRCSLYVMSPELVASMKDDLQGFDVSGATVHFTPQEPLPAALVDRIVRARIEENASLG